MFKNSNIVSVCWGDHLIFGEGDGRLDNIEAIQRRVRCWREEIGASIIHWRASSALLEGSYNVAKGHPRIVERRVKSVSMDILKILPKIVRDLGMQVYLYVSIFDEGPPLESKKIRLVSYHNSTHGQHIVWQSDFSRQNPDYAVVDRSGLKRQWGVLSLAYPEVGSHFIQRFNRLLDGYKFDGLFVCFRSNSRPADFGDQYGFNNPIRNEFKVRYGQDICHEDFNLQDWRDLLGEYITLFLRKLKKTLSSKGLKLGVGIARGEILGPPLSNATLEWRKWVQEGLIDKLVINQNSCQCPSLWQSLWPMHRGYGYLQNYLDGYNMKPLFEDLSETYAPFFCSNSKISLFVARQWDDRSKDKEKELLKHPAVRGLVFSSFRFDNPGPAERGNWVA